MSVHWGGRGPGHVCRSTSGGAVANLNAILRENGFLVLREDGSYLLREDPLAGISAPSLGYPSPLATNPSSVVIGMPADWQSGNVLKLAYSASVGMSSPTILTHTLTDTDITNGTVSIGLPTFVGINYLQGYGNNGTDSSFKSNIVTWGDTTAPVITTSATQSVYETVQLAVALTGTDTGGIASWAIVGGADRLQFQISGSTLQWYNNGTETYSSPQNNPPSSAAPYNVTVQATDYGGNVSTPLAIAVTVNQISVTSFTFTNVNNAPLNTLETSNTVTLAITPTGTPVAASLSGTGFTYSKNGGAYQPAGSFTVQNGDTLTLQDTSGNANSITNVGTVTVGNYSTNWSVATPGSAAVLFHTTPGGGANESQYLNIASPYYQYIHNNNVGIPCLVRATLSAANTKFHLEWHVDGYSGTPAIITGFDDSSQSLSTFLNGTLPGSSGHAGITLTYISGSGYALYANGASSGPAGTAPAVGDTIVWEVDTVANTVSIYRYSGGVATQIGTTTTLTSGIPSSWWAIGGGEHGNGTLATSDSATFNPGNAAFNMTPNTGFNNYYA